MRAQTRTRLLALVSVLLLTALLGLLLSEIVREALAIGLMRAYWVVQIILDMVHQLICWALWLAFGLAFAVSSLLGHRQRVRIGRREPVDLGGVQTLQRLIQEAEGSRYFQGRLALQLAKLATEIQEPVVGERVPSGTLAQRLEVLDVPPEIRAYLERGLALEPEGRAGAWLPSWLVRWWAPARATFSSQAEVEGVVQYLEDQMEV